MSDNKPLKAYAQQLQIMDKALTKVYSMDKVGETEELVTRIAESKLVTAEMDAILQKVMKKNG